MAGPYRAGPTGETGPVEHVFSGTVVEWRGPAPYFFVPLPDEEAADVREVAAAATYGWGVVPVAATVGGTAFETSLIPRDGGYLLPLKNAVRLPLGLAAGSDVTVHLTVRLGTGRAGSEKRACPPRP